MIYVLGATGMLGRYVHSYLQEVGFDVIPVSRDNLDASSSKESICTTLFNLGVRQDDVIINCMGVIKQRGATSDINFLLVNGIFPHILSDYCERYGAKLIHVTTDCVFSGAKGSYAEWDTHDATDIYGKSKSVGEPSFATVIRTSIIGEELDNKKSLLEWVRSNKDKEVDGYVDHFWNGVTCLQFAKICEIIINKDLYWSGVRHVFSPDTLNKRDLVALISSVYGLDVKVNPKITGTRCDRSLSSLHMSMFTIPPLRAQILETKEYNLQKLLT